MPLITPTDIHSVVLDMPDFIIGDTTYQRKFTFNTLIFNDSSKQVIIEGYINFFLNGEDVTGQTIYTGLQHRTMLADNTSVCYATGNTAGLAICDVDKIGIDTDPSSPCYNIPYMKQYDFFREVAMHQSVIIMDMIVNFLRIGIQEKRFDK